MSRLLSMLRSCSPEQEVSPSPTLAILLSERHSSRTEGQHPKPWILAKRLSLRSTNLSSFISRQSTCSIMLDCRCISGYMFGSQEEEQRGGRRGREGAGEKERKEEREGGREERKRKVKKEKGREEGRKRE